MSWQWIVGEKTSPVKEKLICYYKMDLEHLLKIYVLKILFLV